MTFLLYLVPLLLVVTASYWAALAARVRGTSPVLAGLITSFALVEFGSLVPGALGYYRPWPVACVTAAAALVVALALRRSTPPRHAENSTAPAMWPAWTAIVAMFGLMECRLLVRHFFTAPADLIRADYYLDYDVVYYHLPALADFLQHGTLWRTELPFQNYFYAHELVGGFAAVFFHSHWGFFPLHYLTLIVLIAATARIAKHLLPAAEFPRPAATIGATLLALSLWVRIVNTDIFRIGKNDHFVAATALAAFAFFLDHRAHRQRFTLLLGAAAAGLAMGTKPTALVFLPVWAAMVATPFKQWRERVVTFALVIAVFGGFWPLRNFINDGSAIPVGHADGFARTIWHNLGNRLLWLPTTEVAVVLLMLLAAPVALYWAWRTRIESWIWMGAFHTAGALGALFTPFLFFHFETGRGWQLRLIHTQLLAATIVGGALIVSFASVIARRSPSGRAMRLEWLASVIIGIVMILLPFSWAGKSMAGALVWETSEHGGPVGAYAFTRNLPAGTRIASWGAAPAWLLGSGWGNVVFAYYNSAQLTGDEPSQREVLRVLRDFHPEYLVVVAQPAYGPAIPRGLPPGASWLRAQPWLHQEFSDEMSAVFAIQPGWEQAVQKAKLDPRPLRLY